MLQQSLCDHADAWKQFRETHRKLRPRQGVTLTEAEQEDFVKYWEQLYHDYDTSDPPIAEMRNPPNAIEIINSL